LAVFPVASQTVRIDLRWLTWSAQASLTLLPETQPNGYFPILFCDPKTGQLIQRLNFPPAAPEPLAMNDPVLSPSLLPKFRCRRLRFEGAEVPVQFFSGALAVVVGDKAYALVSDLSKSSEVPAAAAPAADGK